MGTIYDLVPLFGVVCFMAFCLFFRKKKSSPVKLVSKSTSTIAVSPHNPAPPSPPPLMRESSDLFTPKASLPRLSLPPPNDPNSKMVIMPLTASYSSHSLSPGFQMLLPDTPPSILITNTDSPSFNLAHQKLVLAPAVHPLAVPSGSDTVMATLLGDIFLTKVTRTVELGSNSAGTIYKGQWQGAPVVLRPVHSDKLKLLRDDIIILKNLRHPNIVVFFGLHQHLAEPGIYVVTEFVEHGNLKEFLKSHNPDYINRQQTALFKQQEEARHFKKEILEIQQSHHATISDPQQVSTIQAIAMQALADMKAEKEYELRERIDSRDRSVFESRDRSLFESRDRSLFESKDRDKLFELRERIDSRDRDKFNLKDKSTNNSRPNLPHSHSQSEVMAPYRGLPESITSPSLPVLTSRDLIKLARDIAAGMMQLEQKSFAHRNLSAASVVVGGSLPGNLIAKLADFGLTRHMDFTPSPRWTAPEALQTKRFTTRSDMWSYGVLLFEIFSFGRLPYEDIADSAVLKWVMDGNRLIFGASTPPIVQTIAYRCWDLNLSKRPTFDEIVDLLDKYLQSPYL